MTDTQKKPAPGKKKNIAGLLALIPLMLFGGAIGFFGAQAIDAMTGGSDLLFFVYLGVMMLGVALGFVVQIILHEGGHLVCGLMSGYRFLSFNVFGLIWQKGPDGRLRVGQMQIAGAGGQCLMIPPEYNDGDFPFTLYNLGGVLANLLAAAIFGLLAWLIPVPVLRLIFGATAVAGIYFAVVNGVPFTTEAIQNDGKNLRCIRRDLDARRAFWVQMSMAAAVAQGTRYRDLPEEWFAPFPEEALNNPIVCTIAVQDVSRQMDRLDFPAALAALRPLLAREKGLLGIYRASLTCDGAVCELITGVAPSSLTEALSEPAIHQVLTAMKDHPSVLRTQYAVALLKDRDGEKAQTFLDRFEKAAPKHPNPAEILGERELLLAIQNALLHRPNNP